jgi:hypothetical protein
MANPTEERAERTKLSAPEARVEVLEEEERRENQGHEDGCASDGLKRGQKVRDHELVEAIEGSGEKVEIEQRPQSRGKKEPKGRIKRSSQNPVQDGQGVKPAGQIHREDGHYEQEDEENVLDPPSPR